MKNILNLKSALLAAAAILLAAMPGTTQAQVNLTPDPNLTISWIVDSWGFSGTTENSGYAVPLPAGLALTTNWNDGWQEDGTDVNSGGATVNNLFDSSSNVTSASITFAGFNAASANDGGPLPQDANGTYDKQMLNGYLNAGPASWVPPITNSFVTINAIPYANYDVVVYFSTDTSGRELIISDGPTSYYCSTPGGAAEVEGANALFLPVVNTNASHFPSADFAFFPAQTNSSITLTTYPLSGNDQWLGIAGFQVIQASNVYVLYGPSPISQIVPVGQPASFTVMAGGLAPQYQWQHAGTNIAHATNATYFIASTALGQDGSYDVVVSNSFSATTSLVSTLTFYTPKTDTWAGVGSTWDTTSLNWTVNGGVTKTNYTETDNVLFGTLGVGQSTISLASIFAPSSITVSNVSYDLTSGGIGGTGSLHVTSNGTLILDTIDTSTGPTLIDSGSTLQVDNGDTLGALGSGPLTNNGALVFDSDGNYAYGFPIYGTGSITNLSSADEITLGAGVNANYLVQAGAGELLLQGNNNLTGGLVVSAGTVYARVGTSLGHGAVVLNGGLLQLIFANDFTGSSMTLGGGVLQGGQGGNNSYDGTVSLAVDSDIDVGAGDTFTLNSTAGLKGGTNNLSINENGSGTLILPGTGNSWASVTIFSGTLQIGDGGDDGDLGGGAITNNGILDFDLAGNIAVTDPINGAGAIDQNGTGTVTLTADNNAAGFFGNINVNSGTLLINGTGGSGVVSVNGGALGGTGIVEGAVVTSAGTTLFAGDPASVGTLTIGSGLTIGGNILVKVHKSLAQSNDLIAVTGGVANAGNGILNVENLGAALAPGDKFTLFSQPVSGGNTLTVVGNGVVWSNNLTVDGSISVESLTAVSHPALEGLSYAAGNLVFSTTNGYAYGLYNILTTTNLEQGPWTLEASGNFDANGDLSATNSVSPGASQQYYKLQLP